MVLVAGARDRRYGPLNFIRVRYCHANLGGVILSSFSAINEEMNRGVREGLTI